jgi:DNA-directed RNA polymerase specialized sigma24 family protein
MTISEYLRELEHLKWSIESKKEKILSLELLATNTTSALTGMQKSPSPEKSRMAEAICKKIDLEASIKEDEQTIEALKAELGAAIDRVEDPKYRAILYKRFIRGMTVECLADAILCSERTAKRLISEASKKLEESLQKMEKC